MEEEPYPYNTPPWRRSYSAESPDGSCVATISEAWEVNMSGPTSDQLELSNGFELNDCSPVFIWSVDSQYLAAPQWIRRLFFGPKQRLLIVEAEHKTDCAVPTK